LTTPTKIKNIDEYLGKYGELEIIQLLDKFQIQKTYVKLILVFNGSDHKEVLLNLDQQAFGNLLKTCEMEQVDVFRFNALINYIKQLERQNREKINKLNGQKLDSIYNITFVLGETDVIEFLINILQKLESVDILETQFLDRILTNLSNNNKENALNSVLKDLKCLDGTKPFVQLIPELITILDSKLRVFQFTNVFLILRFVMGDTK
jgi:hypothetical protein